MTVNSILVKGRRRLRFRNFDDVLADIARVRDEGYVSIGNWTLGQTVKHLGNAMHGSIDGPAFQVPRRLQLAGRWFWRYVILYWRFPPGARLPRKAEQVLVPTHDTEYDDGLKVFRYGISRLASEDQRIAHPVVGSMSVAQWNRFHLRHAELHLSFFVPNGASRVGEGSATA